MPSFDDVEKILNASGTVADPLTAVNTSACTPGTSHNITHCCFRHQDLLVIIMILLKRHRFQITDVAACHKSLQ